MADNKELASKDNVLKLARLIRSIQRIEEGRVCFGTADEDCDRPDCDWRELCLKETQLKGQD